MKRLAHRLLRLYPAAWRARYGAELAALLDDMEPTARDLFDLTRSAVAAHADDLKERWPMNSVPWTAVAGLLAAPLILVLVLVVSSVAPDLLDEGAAEFFILVTPLLVLPAVATMSAFYPPDRPRANRLVRGLGLVSAGVAAVLATISALISFIRPELTGGFFPLGALFILGMAGLSVWFVLNGWLGLQGGIVPIPLSLLSVLYGVSSVTTLFLSLGGPQQLLLGATTTAIANVTTPLWLLSFFLWMVWTAVWLIWHGRQQRETPTLDMS